MVDNPHLDDLLDGMRQLLMHSPATVEEALAQHRALRAELNSVSLKLGRVRRERPPLVRVYDGPPLVMEGYKRVGQVYVTSPGFMWGERYSVSGHITTGRMVTDGWMRLLREDSPVGTYPSTGLWRFLEKFVALPSGTECRVEFASNIDCRVGDILECYAPTPTKDTP